MSTAERWLKRRHPHPLPSADTEKRFSFFGCRTSQLDYIFKDELESYERDGTIDILSVAFSQESQQGYFWYGGCYVQDRMQECSKQLCDLIAHHHAYVYVCGDAESMATGVHRTLVDILEQHLMLSTHDAEAYLERLKEEQRYQRDVWTAN